MIAIDKGVWYHFSGQYPKELYQRIHITSEEFRFLQELAAPSGQHMGL